MNNRFKDFRFWILDFGLRIEEIRKLEIGNLKSIIDLLRSALGVGRWTFGGPCLALCLWGVSGVHGWAQSPAAPATHSATSGAIPTAILLRPSESAPGFAGQATTNSALPATVATLQAGTSGASALEIAALPDIDALRDPFCPIDLSPPIKIKDDGGGPTGSTTNPPPDIPPPPPPPPGKSAIQATGTFTTINGVKHAIINGKMVREGETFKVNLDGRTQRYKLKSIKGKKLEIVPVVE